MFKKILNIKELEQVSSVEITFKRKAIQENDTNFNVFFGINSPFVAGEEWLFLNDIYKTGSIYFKNKTVLRHNSQSAGSKINIKAIIGLKSAQYHIIYPSLWRYYLLKLIAYLVFYNHINVYESFALFYKGTRARRLYINIEKEKTFF